MITKKENRYIVIAMDYFTKWSIAKAIKEATAKTVSKFIYEKIICEHGCLQVLQSDQRTHFVNRVIQNLSEKFKIKHRLSHHITHKRMGWSNVLIKHSAKN